MGLSIAKFKQICDSVFNVSNVSCSGQQRNRKRSEMDDVDEYPYKKFFAEITYTDITIKALNQVWRLHRIVLMQSPYFTSIFNNVLQESSEPYRIYMNIEDSRITADSLNAVFYSMYCDEIFIRPETCVSILATATLFALDDIADLCVEVMNNAINVKTVIQYYEAACQYGYMQLKKMAFNWLEINLLSIYNEHLDLLKHISIELMTDLISSPNLFVIKTEFSLYLLLRTWLYLHFYPNYKPNDTCQLQLELEEEQLSNDFISTFFLSKQPNIYNELALLCHFNKLLSYDLDICFLYTAEGKQFIKAFQALHTEHLLYCRTNLKIILTDNIIPREWLYKNVLAYWRYIFQVHGTIAEYIDVEAFHKYTIRCGRVFTNVNNSNWRLINSHYGIDVIIHVDGPVLFIEQYHRNDDEDIQTSQLRQHFLIKICVTSLNSKRQSIYTQKFDITSLRLEEDENFDIMVIEPKLVYPILISVNMVIFPLMNQHF